MKPLRNQLPPWPLRYANAYLSMKSREYSHWNDGTNGGMPATRIYRTCMASPLDWVLLCSVAAVKSDYWRKDPGDWFACGIGGSFDDQCINAAIEWQNLENTGDLYLNETELQQVDLVYDALCKFCTRMAEADQGEPLPQPLPPKPPKPPEPPKPPQPEPPKPQPGPAPEPENPKPPTGDWRKRFKWIGGIASGILAMWFLIGNLFPPAIGAAVKAILRLIEGIFT